jgi:hypothetical protein
VVWRTLLECQWTPNSTRFKYWYIYTSHFIIFCLPHFLPPLALHRLLLSTAVNVTQCFIYVKIPSVSTGLSIFTDIYSFTLYYLFIYIYIFFFHTGVILWELRQLSQYSIWLQTGQLEFDPRQRRRTLPLTSVSRPALRLTQPPIQWVLGVLS